MTSESRTRPTAPLSFGQERLWLVDKVSASGSEYLVSVAWRLRGALQPWALREAVRGLANRHEVLRTRYVARDGVPEQVVDVSGDVDFEVVDLSGGLAGSRSEWLDEVLSGVSLVRFDLAAEWPLRVRLVRLGADEHVFVFVVHHIAFDGWSVGVLARDLGELYRAVLEGVSPRLPLLRVQYADYAVWQREGSGWEAGLEFWRGRLAGVRPLELPVDRPRPAVWESAGQEVRFTVPEATVAALAELGRSRGATLYMTLLAAFLVLLQRCTGQDDLVVGTPISVRSRRETHDLIGFFVNTLAIRVDLSGDPGFVEVLDRTRTACLEAYEHRNTPFESLVDELAPRRDLSRNPLFQIMFALDSTGKTDLALPGVKVETLTQDLNSSMFDLSCDLTPCEDGSVNGVLNFATSLFKRSSVEWMVEHYLELLAAIVADPHRPIGSLRFFTPLELDAVLAAGEGQHTSRRRRCLHELFTDQRSQTPDAVALVSDDGRLTYGQLDDRANRLARYLRRTVGERTAEPVALCLPRSPDLIVALLAVLKAGFAYQPIDPSHPDTRISEMLQQSGARAVLTLDSLTARLSPMVDRTVALDDGSVAAAVAAESAEDPGVAVHPDDPAYVVFTSGSTGKPKGIVIPHRGIRNHVLWAIEKHRIVPSDAILQKTTISFDAAAWEILAPLVCGGRVVLAPPGAESDPEAMIACSRRHQVTVLQLVPSVLKLLLESPRLDECHSLRLVTCAGEPLPLAACADLRRRLRVAVTNTYGPTESSIDVSSWTYRDGEPGTIAPLGAPLPNIEIRILGSDGSLVGIGVPGEIHIGGDGLALGYLGQPRLTAERFVPDPFAGRHGARLYRTGDLARWRSDGTMQFLGRIDEQIKINGVRVEPGEVENALRQHTAVRDAAVIVEGGASGSLRLLAYVIGDPAGSGDIRRTLQRHLPATMIPSALLFVEDLPLTPNGKLDRRALDSLDAVPESSSQCYVAPRTATERTVVDVWEEILGVERVGVDDDFFGLGGNSLLATRAALRLGVKLGREIPVPLVFQAQSPACLAEEVEKLRYDGERSFGAMIRPLSGPLGLSSGQERMWLVDRLSVSGVEYTVPIVWRLRGVLDVEVLGQALRLLVERHEVLRTRYVARDGVPEQVVDVSGDVDFEVVDLSGGLAGSRSEWLDEVLSGVSLVRFDLAAEWPLRVRLVRLGADEHVFVFVVHHIAFDGWSVGVLARDLGELYRAVLEGVSPRLPLLRVQYADYAVWQREGSGWEAGLEFWRGRLAGVRPLELPVDRPRPAVWESAGQEVRFTVPEATVAALAELGRSRGATLYMTLLAAFLVLLQRCTGQDDLVVGTPISVRSRRETHDLIGFFVNTLAIRVDLSGDPGFVEVLDRTRTACLEAYEHQDVPFDAVVNHLGLSRDLSRNPVFQVMFTCEDAFVAAPMFGEVRASAEEVAFPSVKVDLDLGLSRDANGGFTGVLSFATALFERSTVDRLAREFVRLLDT